MVSINSYLLSTFARRARFGSDVSSFIKRHQILSIIYVNLTLVLVTCLLDFFAGLAFGLSNSFFHITFSAPFITGVFICVHYSVPDAAALLIVLYMNTINLYAAMYTKMPMNSFYVLILHPPFVFFVTSDFRIYHINNFLVCGNLVHHSMRILDIFKVTLTEEQTTQITTLITAGGISVTSIMICCYIQKNIELNLWELARKNYERSENLTREVVQAAEAKDTFISSLSHEIRNPLNSLNGSIAYLMDVMKEGPHRKMLKHAKLSGDILLNLVNNVLDAAKLKSEKMEISYTETKIESVIEKVFSMNSEALENLKITAEAYVTDHLPHALWIDPSRLLQIMMNLISNAIKFTKSGGKVQVYVDWCSIDQIQGRLEEPIKRIKHQRTLENDEVRESASFNQQLLQKPQLTTENVNINTDVDIDEMNTNEVITLRSNIKNLNTNIKYSQKFLGAST